MWTVSYIFLCSFIVVSKLEVSLENDRPFLMVKLGDKAELNCCCNANASEGQTNVTWYKHKVNTTMSKSKTPINMAEDDFINTTGKSGKLCGTISFKSVTLNDTGVYRCLFTQADNITVSHGTYLHVYEPLEKTINLSENTKNKILTAQGILLLLCVLLPAFSILCQSKRLHELEKKKVTKEEENIYQGLNLDDCYAAYDQIERSQNNGPYQDVCNVLGDDIQLEKP